MNLLCLPCEAETLQHAYLGLTGNPGNRANIRANTQQEHEEIALVSRGNVQSRGKAHLQVNLWAGLETLLHLYPLDALDMEEVNFFCLLLGRPGVSAVDSFLLSEAF